MARPAAADSRPWAVRLGALLIQSNRTRGGYHETKVRTWRRTRPTAAMAAATIGVFLIIVGAQQVVRASCPNLTSLDPGYGAWQPCNGNGHCFAYTIDDTCTSKNGTGYQCLDYGQLAPGYEWATAVRATPSISKVTEAPTTTRPDRSADPDSPPTGWIGHDCPVQPRPSEGKKHVVAPAGPTDRGRMG